MTLLLVGVLAAVVVGLAVALWRTGRLLMLEQTVNRVIALSATGVEGLRAVMPSRSPAPNFEVALFGSGGEIRGKGYRRQRVYIHPNTPTPVNFDAREPWGLIERYHCFPIAPGWVEWDGCIPSGGHINSAGNVEMTLFMGLTHDGREEWQE